MQQFAVQQCALCSAQPRDEPVVEEVRTSRPEYAASGCVAHGRLFQAKISEATHKFSIACAITTPGCSEDHGPPAF